MSITQARLLTLLDAAEHFQGLYENLRRVARHAASVEELQSFLDVHSNVEYEHIKTLGYERGYWTPQRVHENNVRAAKATQRRRRQGAKPRLNVRTTPHDRDWEPEELP